MCESETQTVGGRAVICCGRYDSGGGFSGNAQLSSDGETALCDRSGGGEGGIAPDGAAQLVQNRLFRPVGRQCPQPLPHPCGDDRQQDQGDVLPHQSRPGPAARAGVLSKTAGKRVFARHPHAQPSVSAYAEPERAVLRDHAPPGDPGAGQRLHVFDDGLSVLPFRQQFRAGDHSRPRPGNAQHRGDRRADRAVQQAGTGVRLSGRNAGGKFSAAPRRPRSESGNISQTAFLGAQKFLGAREKSLHLHFDALLAHRRRAQDAAQTAPGSGRLPRLVVLQPERIRRLPL